MNLNLENEIWKDIEGYEGNYKISNCGRVKSLNYRHTKKEKILKPHLNTSNYLQVELKGKPFQIHRLVAKAFIPNPDNLPQVNHKDENTVRNDVDNLEWCTQQYNIDYSQSKEVYQYNKEGDLIKKWKSCNECGRNGFNAKHVSECCRSKLKTHKGYIWSYES